MSTLQAEYADWKIIKTRDVIQIVFEIPNTREAEDRARAVLGGMPRFGNPSWFGISRLNLDVDGNATAEAAE